jgi:type IX secretion system PorP/SprF family membrane protein
LGRGVENQIAMQPQLKKKSLKETLVLSAFFLALGLMSVKSATAQDPSFSQFFSSPLNINPALTANINSEWRAISNIRHQWAGVGQPYNTGTISFDSKILGNKLPENSILGLGGMLMYDRVMGGAINSTYGSLNLSYNLQLAEDSYGGVHRFGAGLSGIYGHRRVDYTKLNFGEQFTGYGFDTNLPSGESSLSQMKPYFSTSAGLLYTYESEYSSFDAGVSGFHFNKPKQTFLEDEKQILPTRYVAHANYELFLSDQIIINANGIYQKQSTTSYFSVGGGLGYVINSDEAEEEQAIFNAGVWYWSNNAIIPYVGFVYKKFQVGLSYDITINKLSTAEIKPRSWEISLILRGGEKKDRIMGVIPCPWK